MNLLERRRELLGGKKLLPFVIWQNGMTSVSEIPIEFTESHCTLTYGTSASGSFVELAGRGPATKSVSFTIPALYIKKAKTCNIVWYIKFSYRACKVKLVCDGQTLTDTGTENSQTRIFTPDISAFTGDLTVTFTGDNVRIYNFVIE